MQTTINRSPATDPGRLERVRALLKDYPDVSESDRIEILWFLKKAPAIDNALLSSTDEVAARLRQFQRDHAKEFELGFKSYAVVAVLLALLGVAVALLWNSGLN